MALKPNEQARQLRDNYAAMHGDTFFANLGLPVSHRTPLVHYQEAVNAIYQQAPALDSLIVASYRHFAWECIAQFRAMVSAGVKVQFCDNDPTPMATRDDGTSYPSIKLLMAEFEQTGILKVYRSVDGFHPLLDQHVYGHVANPDDVSCPRIEETANSIFRAVHDYFGHLASGGYFNWDGETRAYYSHASMFSTSARKALFCETVAQQCVYAVTGDYAEQKCVNFDAAWHYPPIA